MSRRPLTPVLLLALALALVAPAAAQAALPPEVTTAFAQDIAAAGTPVGLTFTITNVDVESQQTGVGFNVELPPGLFVATPTVLLSTCDGTAVAAPGGSLISLSGATLGFAGMPPADSCSIRVDVVAPAVGLFDVVAGAPFSNESVTQPGSPSAPATLRVLALSTSASPGIVAGAGTLVDVAAVAGPVAPQPGARMTFGLYGPDDATCAGAPAFVSTVPFPAGLGVVTSAPFAPAAPGTYRWRAFYSNDGGAAVLTAPCNAPGESVLVRPPPSAPPPPPVPSRPTCAGKPATIVVTAGRGFVDGTSGDDVIVGSDRGETIDGHGGDDTICAGDGNDRVRGSSGDDLLLGEGGNDDVRGGTGDDRMGGGGGPDRVDGGTGDDVLDEQNLGGVGHDRLFGGPGRDIVRTAGGASDKINCGTGADRATLDRFDRQVACESRILLPPPIALPR
jgi:hypothetical protein